MKAITHTYKMHILTRKEMLYAFFWVIPQRLNFICRQFGTLCPIFIHRQIGMKYDWVREMLGYVNGKRFGSKIARTNRKEGEPPLHCQPPSYCLRLFSNQTFSCIYTRTFLIPTCLWRWNRQCSETSAHKIQMPGNYPEESIQHSEHGGSLKSRRKEMYI